MSIALVRSLRFSTGTLGLSVILLVLSHAGGTLIVDRPAPADAILVLSGDYYGRMPHAIDLYKQGYAQQIIVDEDASHRFYGRTLAERRQQELAGDPSIKATVCPIYGATTSAESRDVARCLDSIGVRKILIVTSDFHTRRAFSILRSRIPSIHWSVAAAKTDYRPESWWESGSSTGTLADEWMSFVFWKTFEEHI